MMIFTLLLVLSLDYGIASALLATIPQTDKSSYVAVVEQFLTKNRPFRGSFELEHSSSVTQHLTQEALSCLDDFCSVWSFDKELVKDLLIPKYAANSYLRPSRMAVEGGSDLFERWPAVRTLAAGASSPFMQCPSAMHLLVWHLSPDGATLRASIFSGVGSGDGDASGGIFRSYDAPAGEGTAVQEASVASSATATRGEYVLVPHDHLLRLQCESAQAGCVVVAQCFVDAANLNSFRQAVAGRAEQSAEDRALHEALTAPTFSPALPRVPTDALLREFASPTPAEGISAQDAAPSGGDSASASTAAAAGGNRRDRRKRAGGSDFKDWQELSKWNMLVTALTLPAPARPAVDKVGRQSVALTWRSPFVAAASDKTRFGFTMQACEIGGGDDSCVRAQFLRGEAGSAALAEELDADALRLRGVEATLLRGEFTGLRPDTSYEVRGAVLYDQSQSPFSPPSSVFRTAPLSVPSAADGAVQFSTEEVQTRAADGTPDRRRTVGALRFQWPNDDGGKAITGFHVYVRSSSRRQSAEEGQGADELGGAAWRWEGAHRAERNKAWGTISLPNLAPDRFYQFRVAAYNVLGSAPLSSPTDVSLVAAADHHIAHGWGHENYLGGLTAHYLEHHLEALSEGEKSAHHAASARQLRSNNFSTSSDSCPADMVMIAMDSDLLSNPCGGSGLQYPLWRSHWTSPTLSVHARAAFTDHHVQHTTSLDGVQDGGLRGRVAFTPRGVIPFAEKAARAQAAGALAIVIVDDGQCTGYDQRCLPGGSKARSEGFAAGDLRAHWEKIHIPVAFLLREHFVQWRKDHRNEIQDLPVLSTSSDEL